MSDQMSQMMDPEDAKGAAGTEEAMKSTRSIMNPNDAAAMKQEGVITPDMTIADFFSTFGIDVNTDPITRLEEFQKQQASMADPLNKMKTIAGAGQQNQSAPPMGQQESPAPVGRPPEVQTGLGGLKTRMG
jgi:hypothetical protein